ncbi:MAG: NAD(P)H-hydrate dehydratase [Leucobacter sp.]|nr:NAD(P)H-hydrate dehydratase [Leucobacter sp.]
MITPWSPAQAAACIATPAASSDKYRRGVLGVRTGSAEYPGAAVLGVEAAWRAGVGMVRYVPPLGDALPGLGLPAPAAAVLAARPETVFAGGDAARAARCDAWLTGSGTDPASRSFVEREALHALFAGDAPLVVDAGALPELADPAARIHAPTAITPHAGEFLGLWRAAGLGESAPDAADAAPALAERLGATVLLKGSVSTVATPGGFTAAVGPATPWLATAGTGDVLAGILGALAATHAGALRDDPESFGPLAASAALLHDLAARHASRGGRAPIVALDVALALPAVIAELLG